MPTQQPRSTQAPDPSSLLAAAPDAAFLVGRGGSILWANHGLHGEHGATLVGALAHEQVPPEHRERVRVACDGALASGRADRFELGERGPGGPLAWYDATASPVMEGARVEAALLLFRDITARKREEERLRRSESLLVDAQGVAHMGTWEWEPDAPHALWSAELYRIYGLTPETYTPSYEGYLKMVHSEDRQRVMDATRAAIQEHVPYSHDERIFRPDGTMRHLHTWAIPVLGDRGELVRLIGVCQDVTEQRMAESAMRAQTMTRALARRLLLDVMRRGQVAESSARDVGRALARDSGSAGELNGLVHAFRDMGLGELRFEKVDGERYTFVGADLLERRASALPTCFVTLGYLEGAVGRVTGKRALGNEMRCQSMGHAECVFVVQA